MIHQRLNKYYINEVDMQAIQSTETEMDDRTTT